MSWERVERIFDRARQLPAAERSAFLDEACAGDAALRHRLDSLLAAHDALNAPSEDGLGFLDSLDPARAGALLDHAEASAAETEGIRDEPKTVGRYRVVRRLGRGGMGVVYLARDPALDRPVALKLLADDFGTDPDASRRLLDEARAASALDHPNIATIYEVGHTDDGPYIAMAYCEGETLAERLSRGPLPAGEAADVAAQVADGLAAAHDSGIVHRDIKPANLIIGPRGLVKIVDFGVARVADRTRTRTDGALGTVAYMSPAQTRGDPVDGRADIWALGVVLYEMLTGTRPFDADANAALIYGIRNDDPVPIATLRPDVPAALAAVVARCLEKDPERRFSSAADLAGTLRAATGAAPGARPPGDGRQPRWRRAGAVLAVLVALLTVGAGVQLAARSLGVGPTTTARELVSPGEPIVLADFTAGSGQLDMARIVTEALRIDLLHSPALRLAEARAVAAALRRMERDPAAGVPESAALELALREGYKAVISGEIAELGGSYILNARVVAASSGATLEAVRETARDSTELIDAVDRLSKRVRERIGESLRLLSDAEPLPRVATASLPALRRYAEAHRLAWSGGDDARIAALLEETVALDSSFAAAHRGLATTYWNMRADRSRTLAATRAAYALRERLPERERFLIEASYQWQVLGDPRGTEDAYRRVLAVDPDNVTAHTNLGLALLFAGRPVDAERVLRAAAASDPEADLPDALHLNLARALYFQGRTADALAVIDSIAGRPGGSPGAQILRVRLLGGDHRWAEAEAAASALLEEHGTDSHVRAEALRLLWHLALARGRLAEAEMLYDQMATLLDDLGALDALARATIQWADTRHLLLDDSHAARAGVDRLLQRHDLDLFTAGATLAPRAAAVLAAAGDTAAAARLVDRWEALPDEDRGDPDTFSPQLARARIDLAAGRPDSAVHRLRRASSGTIQAIHYLPDLGVAYGMAGRPDSAIATLERYLDFRHTRRIHRIPGHLGRVLVQLAQLYEERGDTVRAITTHGQLVDLWANADPDLQPRIDHARRRISALSNRDR